MTATTTAAAGTVPADRTAEHRRLWSTVGWLFIGYVVLTFVGVSMQVNLVMGQPRDKVAAALAELSLPRNFAGGYVEYLSVLAFLAGALLLARLLRGESVAAQWLSSLAAGAAVAFTAVTVGVGFPAGAAALYDGQHGAPLLTAIALDDLRGFAFFLSGGLLGLFTLAVAGAVRATGALPRWVSYTGFVLGVLHIVVIPAAGMGLVNLSAMLGLLWIVAVGVAALRWSRRASGGRRGRAATA